MNTFCAQFAGRLREERERLGMSQAQFGSLGGIGKLTQLKYEKGDRSPSVEYLHRVAQSGVDIDYLVLGIRVPIQPDPTPRGVLAALLSEGGKYPMPSEVDAGLLANVIAGIETALVGADLASSPTQKARAIANLYMAFSRSTPTDRQMIGKMAALLVSDWISDRT
jgi:transcriptional regulator with XRE-family HTH domain